MATTPIIGTITVGGTSKTISGGYVNIGGVWKPISKTYVNINGVWKNAWKDLYTWKKYTVATSKVYTQSKSGLMNASYPTSKAACYASAYTFNASTGIYTLTNPKVGTFNDFKTSTKYFMVGESDAGDTIYERVSHDKSWGSIHLEYYELTSTSSETEVQGTYISDVTSENAFAYPTNGVHTDGYWYVKQ